MPRPPANLIAAFRASESPEQIAALLHEDGFDEQTIRVLGAFQQSDHEWSEPPRPCPDDGRPTARAWAWLVSGMKLDYVALADAAGLTPRTAQQKIGVLLGNRLIYPSGEVNKWAFAALQKTISKRLGGGGKKKPASEDAN